MEIKEGLLYNKSNLWFNEKDNSIGITDYAQEQLGEISFVDLSSVKIGTEICQACYNENIPTTDSIPDCSIESAKAVSEIHSPVCGIIKEVNSDVLDDNPELLNSDPYGTWLFKVEPSNLEEDKKKLMNADAYKTYINGLSD